MIGAIVYQLRAEHAAWLPIVHGRFMHAAFFAALRTMAPDISRYVHDQMDSKPFTVAGLQLPAEKRRIQRGQIYITEGQLVSWRVTALHTVLLQVLLELPLGYVFRIGSLSLRLEGICADSAQNVDCGVIDENELIADCLAVESVQHITFHFQSPVAFRFFDQDYPWPLPGYVFASLADKWNQAGMPLVLDREAIREEAGELLPEEWKGRSRRLYFDRHRGVLGFEGEFTYGLQQLVPERQTLYLLLAQFAVFSGTGRMTAQGLGQTRITYN